MRFEIFVWGEYMWAKRGVVISGFKRDFVTKFRRYLCMLRMEQLNWSLVGVEGGGGPYVWQ
jgi:hypothetical protein